MGLMSQFRIHQPPPDAVVEELVKAGLSTDTAQSMERWKAVEILELLRRDVTDAMAPRVRGPEERGTI